MSGLTILIMLAGLATLSPASPAVAAGVVGDGTPASCTDAALTGALAGGGTVTFNCGPSPVVVALVEQKVITENTVVDGGELITLDAQGTTRHFFVTSSGELELVNITLTNANGAASDGGSIYNNGGGVALTNSTVSGNSGTNGGGIYNNGGTLTLTNSTISGNTATSGGFDHSGGGIYNENGPLVITNSTISGNTAAIGGGFFHSGGTVTVTNSTISDNSGDPNLGGGYYNASGIVYLRATILADNPSGDNCQGTATESLGENISDDISYCNLIQTGDMPETDPQLGPLQDNGGPTETHMPGDGSPAIDGAPSCPTAVDQTGTERPQGSACDIGSVEVPEETQSEPTYPICVSSYTGLVTSPLSGVCNAGQVQLTELAGESFCINPWTGQVSYTSRRPCAAPRFEHTLPDDGDLLTCVSFYTGANRWVTNHAKCTAYEAPNTIPAA